MYASALITLLTATGLTHGAAFSHKLSKRQSGPTYSWMNSEAGNVGVGFGDTTVQTGTVDPVSLVQQLSDYCLGGTGTCTFDTYSQDGDVIGYDKETITVTVEHQDTFFAPDDGQTLIDILAAAVGATTRTEQVCDVCGCAESYCWPGGDEVYLTMHYTPNIWSVVVPDPNDPEGAAPVDVIQVTVSSQTDSDGFCSTFTDVGAAVAGAVGAVPAAGEVGGALSAAITLAGLFCPSG